MFDSSGLTEDLLAIYRLLLRRPDLGHATRLNDLAAELGRTEDETSRDLQKLRDLGFLVPSWYEGVEYPMDPALAFSRLTAGRQQEIDALSEQLRSDKLAADRFTADLANFLVQRTTRDVEILEGRELANQRMQRFQPAKSMWAFLQDSAVGNWSPETFPDRPHLERGVELRYLIPESFRKRPGARAGRARGMGVRRPASRYESQTERRRRGQRPALAGGGRWPGAARRAGPRSAGRQCAGTGSAGRQYVYVQYPPPACLRTS